MSVDLANGKLKDRDAKIYGSVRGISARSGFGGGEGVVRPRGGRIQIYIHLMSGLKNSGGKNLPIALQKQSQSISVRASSVNEVYDELI